jgi:hypothetical protein
MKYYAAWLGSGFSVLYLQIREHLCHPNLHTANNVHENKQKTEELGSKLGGGLGKREKEGGGEEIYRKFWEELIVYFPVI